MASQTRKEPVSVLLTGQADLTAAIKAINEGQIFRFLVKPCPPDMLSSIMEEAQRQYELITAEKELLQRTLVGAVKALVDVMTFANPDAMGRASRIRRRSALIAKEIHVEQKWQVEIASLLSQVSSLSLPAELVHKLAGGMDLDEAEHNQARSAHVAANAVIAQIPRLEAVAHLLNHAMGLSAESVTDASLRRRIGLLKLVMELDRLESKGISISSALDLARDSGAHEADLLEATARAIARSGEIMVPAVVKIVELRTGMIVDQDISTRRGVLIAPRGCEVTLSFLEHIRQFSYELEVSTVSVLEPRKQL